MEFLERIFLSFLVSSLTASIVILIVIVILGIFNNRISIRVKNVLWILVLIKLLIPSTYQTDMNVFSILNEKYISASYWQGENNNVNRLPETTQFDEKKTNSINSNSNAINIQIEEEKKIQNKSLIVSALKIASGIWLIGVLSLTLASVVALYSLKKNTKKLKNNIDVEILTLVKRCRDKVNIKSRIPIYVYDGINSPCTLGIMKPKIYIPKYILSIKNNNQLSYIFLHELIRYKRKDLFYNFLSIIALLIHWYNPLAWYAVKKMKLYRECACDASVLEFLNEEENGAESNKINNEINKSLTGNESDSKIVNETSTNNNSDKNQQLNSLINSNDILGNNESRNNIYTEDNNVNTNIYNENSKGSTSKKNDWNYPKNNNEKVIGWQQYNNNWYHFNENGVMDKNTVADGYQLGLDGVWIH